MNEQHPHADIIDNIAVSLWKGKHTIDELTDSLKEDSDLIISLLDEIIEVKGAVMDYKDGIPHYYLTENGEKDARFIAIAIGKYDIPFDDINESEAVITHLQILETLRNTSKNNPIELKKKFQMKYPKLEITRKHFWSRVFDLEDCGYMGVIHGGKQDEYRYITERGRNFLNKMKNWDLKSDIM